MRRRIHRSKRPLPARQGHMRRGAIALIAVVAAVALFAFLFPFSGSPIAPDVSSDDGGRPGDGVQEVSPALSASREVYPYSVVRGGVYSVAEFTDARTIDPVVAQHYDEVSLAALRIEQVNEPRQAFMSYRIGDQIYWTKQKLSLHAGEQILTDGKTAIRARCGNRLSEIPMIPTSEEEPPLAAFDRRMDLPASEALGGHQSNAVDALTGSPMLATLPSLATPGTRANPSGDSRTAWAGVPGGSGGVPAGGTRLVDVGSGAFDGARTRTFSPPTDEWIPSPDADSPTLDDPGPSGSTSDFPTLDGPGPIRWTPHPDSPPGGDWGGGESGQLVPPAEWAREDAIVSMDLPTNQQEPPAAVPEPTSLTLLGTGAAWLALKRFRSRRRRR